MKTKLRKDCKYAMIVPTSMGVHNSGDAPARACQRYVYYAGYERGVKCAVDIVFTWPAVQGSDPFVRAARLPNILKTNWPEGI